MSVCCECNTIVLCLINRDVFLKNQCGHVQEGVEAVAEICVEHAGKIFTPHIETTGVAGKVFPLIGTVLILALLGERECPLQAINSCNMLIYAVGASVNC
jgi:hypothetical protein